MVFLYILYNGKMQRIRFDPRNNFLSQVPNEILRSCPCMQVKDHHGISVSFEEIPELVNQFSSDSSFYLRVMKGSVSSEQTDRINPTTFIEFFNKTSETRSFLEKHINSKTLCEKDKSFLVTQGCIFLSSTVGFQPSQEQKQKLATTIKLVFSVDIAQEDFYNIVTNKGLLEERFSKLKNVMPSSGGSTSVPVSSTPLISRKRKIESPEDEESSKSELDAIFFHQEDFDILESAQTRDLVEFCLSRTAKVRRTLYEQKSLKIFDFYFDDYRFINFDFNLMFPQATSFFQYWDLISKTIDEFYQTKAIVMSHEIDEWPIEVAQFLKLLDLLPASTVNRSKSSVFINNESSFEKLIKFGQCKTYNDKLPYIIGYGPSKKHIERYVIHFEDKFIEFETGTKFKIVVDVLCKIYHIFQIKWDHSLSVFYSFFSTKVYGISRRITQRIMEIFGNLTMEETHYSNDYLSENHIVKNVDKDCNAVFVEFANINQRSYGCIYTPKKKNCFHCKYCRKWYDKKRNDIKKKRLQGDKLNESTSSNGFSELGESSSTGDVPNSKEAPSAFRFGADCIEWYKKTHLPECTLISSYNLLLGNFENLVVIQRSEFSAPNNDYQNFEMKTEPELEYESYEDWDESNQMLMPKVEFFEETKTIESSSSYNEIEGDNLTYDT